MRCYRVLVRLMLFSTAVIGLALCQPAGLASAQAAGPAEPASAPADQPALRPEMVALKKRLRAVLRHYGQRKLNTVEHNAWEMMHMVIAYGVRAEVFVGGRHGELQNAIGWLCFNRAFQGDRILTLEHGRPIGVIGVGLQGHPGQLLAILAQANLRRDYPMHVAGREFTVDDLIENEKFTCRSGMELTFKLIAAAHYLNTDATWRNEAGQTWSIPRLIHDEIDAPIQGAACGGTHRLMGLSQAVRKRQKEGKPLDGEFSRAQQYLQDYHRWAFRLQNHDGSFSTQWLEYREARPDVERRLQTSGHILEWLAFSLSDAELLQPETVAAVEYLTNLLASQPGRNWSIGPLGHGLHALALYDQRVFRSLEKKLKHVEPIENELPPARAPRSSELPSAPQADDSTLSRRLRLHHVQRSLLPPRDKTDSDGPVLRLGSEKGPLLAPPQQVLK
jgi:hypothetical protein